MRPILNTKYQIFNYNSTILSIKKKELLQKLAATPMC